MTIEFVTTFGREALMVVLIVAAPILGFALLTGVVISIFQAVTQIKEMTLTFIPKIIITLVAAMVFGPWILRILLSFTSNLFISLPQYMKM